MTGTLITELQPNHALQPHDSLKETLAFRIRIDLTLAHPLHPFTLQSSDLKTISVATVIKNALTWLSEHTAGHLHSRLLCQTPQVQSPMVAARLLQLHYQRYCLPMTQTNLFAKTFQSKK